MNDPNRLRINRTVEGFGTITVLDVSSQFDCENGIIRLDVSITDGGERQALTTLVIDRAKVVLNAGGQVVLLPLSSNEVEVNFK